MISLASAAEVCATSLAEAVFLVTGERRPEGLLYPNLAHHKFA
jgi:hypothetical protein